VIALQFDPLTDYFLGMREKGKPGQFGGLTSAGRVTIILGLIALATGCNERDRLTFPDPGDGIGPVTTIDQPNGADTTVNAGPEFFVNGRTIDPDGVDTVYFLVIGGNQNFQPFRPNPPADTVRFGLPITTIGHGGDTMVVQIHGVDSQGNRGGTSSRRIVVR
jgi:hypothetical protein